MLKPEATLLAVVLLGAGPACAGEVGVVEDPCAALSPVKEERRQQDYFGICRYRDDNAKLEARQGSRVVFFGDSITDNWGSPSYGGFFPGKPYVNRGIGGQATGQMLVRFRADVLALHPAVVVILAGTNDISGNAGPTSLEQVEGNLASMAELARAHEIKVVLASLLPVSDDKTGPDGQRRVQTKDRPPAKIQAVNTWMAAYAKANGNVYLDYHSAVADASDRFKGALTDDGLHPNAAGYAVMAPLAEKAIAEALRGSGGSGGRPEAKAPKRTR